LTKIKENNTLREMVEAEQLVSKEDQKFFDISKEKLKALDDRLRRFIYEQEKIPLVKLDPNSKEVNDDMHRKRCKSLGFVSPSELENFGVGSIFWVVWLSEGTSYGEDGRTPMSIWLAKGISEEERSTKENVTKLLKVSYHLLGTLKHGEEKIDINTKPKMLSYSISQYSPVILCS
jgi:hypothetical protein